ncbi:hypothetical protein CR540_18600 [Escherichia coli]|nr:hypothetical protein CR540_18600 [Escherichia coli]
MFCCQPLLAPHYQNERQHPLQRIKHDYQAKSGFWLKNSMNIPNLQNMAITYISTFKINPSKFL